MPKIICLQGAVHNSPTGEVIFYECDEHCLNTTNKEWLTDSSSRFGHKGYQTCNTVKTIRIDDLIKLYSIPELIKIDVEGGEYEALLTLTQKVPLLCFEWASEVNAITFRCIEYLETLGFTEFFIQYGDNYTFRPSEWNTSKTVKNELENTTLKAHWGMIWAR